MASATAHDQTGGDTIDEPFILAALKVYSGLFVIPEVLASIPAVEDECGANTLYDSVQKMQLIYTRLKDSDAHGIKWTFEALHDMLKAKTLAPGALAARAIKGEGHHGKGICELIQLKLQFRDYLLNTGLDGLSLTNDVKTMIRRVYMTHKDFRRHCGYDAIAEGIDLSWQAGWPPSATSFCRAIEEIVYGTDHDQTLNAGLRSRKSAEDLIEMNTIGELMVQVKELDDAETSARKPTTSGNYSKKRNPRTRSITPSTRPPRLPISRTARTATRMTL